jgi:uncharacterized protein (TIGR04255 family)
MTKTDYPHLRNAPIVEAVLEILVDLPTNFEFSQIEALYEKIKDDFPQKKIRNRFEQTITAEPGGKVDSRYNDLGDDGIIANSQDGKNVVQFRLDGVSYSQLKPYTSWKQVSQQALKFWDIYRSSTFPTKIRRLGLRYINMLEIPAGVKVSDVFKNPLPVPIKDNQDIMGFATHVVFRDKTNNFVGMVSQSTQPPLEEADRLKVRILLDINVMYDIGEANKKIEIDEIFSELRTFKNKLFFESLTEEEIERYK